MIVPLRKRTFQKKLLTRYYSQKNSCEHIGEVIHDVTGFLQDKFQTDIIARNL